MQSPMKLPSKLQHESMYHRIELIQDNKFSNCVMPLLGRFLDVLDLTTQAHSEMTSNHHVFVGNHGKETLGWPRRQ